MLLSLHRGGPGGIRGYADDAVILADGSERRASFLLAADGSVQDWTVADVDAVDVGALAPVFAAQPDVFLLGTGAKQKFPPAAAMAACLARRIGLEAMDNAAAARTFNVLVSEGRSVLLGMVLPG
jgi:uncharacterized protein